ncbi:hypothetical protein [Microcoleus sp. S13C4]|uniref:hypothetical protein n=1 Tax=Microcoleus sp. S13C4 TaxID=3055410 RepID=UPI002FD246B3
MNQKISIELVNSIASEHLGSTVRDFAEVGLDTILKEGVFRDVPFFNTVVSLYQASVEIRQQLFIQKIINFWKELPNTSLQERQKFVEWMGQNPKQKRIFGENLLLLIDRADSIEKPSILGRLLDRCTLGDISYEDMMRLWFIVDRVYMPDLNYLTSFTYGIQSNPNIAASLENAGLLILAGMEGGYLDKRLSGGVIYELNDYGKMLLQYGLDSAV